jgi:hypothetical protein
MNPEFKPNCPHKKKKNCKEKDKKKCEYDRSNCHFDKDRQKLTNKTMIWLAFSIGIIFILIAAIIDNSNTTNFTLLVIKTSMVNFGQVAMLFWAGSILLDIPHYFNYFKTNLLDALVDKKYLKQMSADQLRDIRDSSTEVMHLKDIPHMGRGLINLDGKICSLLSSPFYETYRQVITCKIVGDYIIKKIAIDYELINPYGKDNKVKASIGIKGRTFIDGDRKDYTTIHKLSYRKDKNSWINLKEDEDYKLKDTESVDVDSMYNAFIEVKDKDGNELLVEFEKNLIVSCEYETKVFKNEITYTNRLRYPAKSFRIDFHIDDKNSNLHGQLFGTLLDTIKYKINHYNENRSLIIESYDWLLPKNGVFVVITNAKE